MAFTVSQIVTNTVMGDLRVKIVNVTADATTGSFDLGMGNLVAVLSHPKSMASFVNSGSTRNMAVISPNAGVSGTSIVGTVGMTGCIAGDVYTLVAYAKS
jgi:hypothetical protein